MDYHIHFLVTFLFLIIVQVSNQWRAPSFISQWYDVEAMVTGDLLIEHGLGEVPAKVDVQIKVIQNNEEFIFTGTGTAQRDDDFVEDFGGIVYLYNNVHVILYPPYMGLYSSSYGGIAFTVQVSNQWKAPSFISQWYDVEAMVTGDLLIEHGLGEVPAKVDVQIKVIQNNEEFIFTGTGTAQRDDDFVEDFGGIVYLYNNVHVILYPPYMGLYSSSYGGIAFTDTKCNDPGSIYNATYSVTGLSPTNTATYTCNPGNQQLGGDAIRVCQTNGTWSGIPIVCIDMPTGSITVPVVHTAATLAETMEQMENALRVDIKETNAYHRRHTSAYDPRPSALYIGTAGVVILCSVVAALVLPDFITLFRHMQNFTDIYRH